jgi:peptidoglycan hydrolase-like protein with peptidoglycan-binding domain
MGTTTRGLALVAALALLAGCSQVRQVGKPEAGTRQDSPEAAGEAAPKKKKAVKAAPGRPPVPATPNALLDDGAAGEIQGALADRGYLASSTRDGRLDGATAAALRRFQEDEGLAATGFPDRETLRRLGLDPQQAYRTTKDEADEEP